MTRIHLGDEGETSVFGKRVKKTSGQIRVLGSLDELSAWIELCAYYSDKKMLEKVRNDIYKISANIAGFEKGITKKDADFLEEESEKIDLKIKPKGFVRFEGEACFINIARTVCRRVELELLDYNSKPDINSVYLNRLSTFLFSLALKSTNRKILHGNK
jgi:ATP:cob(I)alamin adenosyltransferase